MIFDAETRVVRRRPSPHTRPDEFYRPPPLALTPTELWYAPDLMPRRRPRRRPPVEQVLAFRVPAAVALTPTPMWLEPPLPVRRRKRRLPPLAVDLNWPFPYPLPPRPPIPVPPVVQTLYAVTASLQQPAFTGTPAFLGPNGAQRLFVGTAAGRRAFARPDAMIAIIFNLAPAIGATRYITNATVRLRGISLAGRFPRLHEIGDPTVIAAQGRQRQAVQQRFFGLAPGGEYLAIVSIGMTDGSGLTFVAPFHVAEV